MSTLNNCWPESRNKEVYDFLRQSDLSSFNFELENTNGSQNSFSFAKEIGEDNRQCIERVFGISIPETLPVDYRARTIHSSALAALLCFSQISSNNTISVNGIEYSHVFLEWGNTCTGQGGMSKIDVALFNDKTKQALLLEAKFSEYLKYSPVTLEPIYKAYFEEMYNSLLPDDIEFDSTSLQLKTRSNQSHYCEGIKQMICHHIGAKNMIADERFKDYSIMLGEILFDFPTTDNDSLNEKRKLKLNDYISIYYQLASKINSLNIERITMIPRVITYQEIFTKQPQLINDRVKHFYQF